MNYEELCISPDSSIKEALCLLESTSRQILFVVDGYNHLLGTITDGDIRRGILQEVTLTAKVMNIMNNHPRAINQSMEKKSC